MLYLRSDSTTVPLADAKLRGPSDAFKKGFQTTSSLGLLKSDDIICNPAITKDGFICDLYLMYHDRSVTSNRGTRGQIVNKAKRIFNCLNWRL